MAYRKVVDSGAPLPVVQVHGDHVELICTFATGGTEVNVASPSMLLRVGDASGATVSIPSDSLLVPFSKYGTGIGMYHVCFLAGGWLDDGDYHLTLSGSCSGSTIAQTGTFSARSASGVQGYIDALRAALRDYDGSLYTIEDPSKELFSDGDLYSALSRALDKINYTKPIAYTWTMATCLWPGILIEGGLIYALHARGILEVANTFSYSDEISFGIDRSQKYVTMLSQFANNWELSLLRVKQDYAFSKAFPIGLGTLRLPYQQMRIFSFIPHLSSYFNWGT